MAEDSTTEVPVTERPNSVAAVLETGGTVLERGFSMLAIAVIAVKNAVLIFQQIRFKKLM